MLSSVSRSERAVIRRFAKLRISPIVDVTTDKTCEFREVVEAVIEQVVDNLEIHVQVAVDDHVAEAGHGANPCREHGRKNPEVEKSVDGGRVARNVSSRARGKVRCDVEHVLGT